MKKRYLSVMAAAAALTLSACGNPATTDEPINEPLPGEEQPMPGDDGINDPLDDMDGDGVDDTTEPGDDLDG